VKSFRRWQWVRVVEQRGFTIPCNAVGRVVKIDNERSVAGYSVCVAWKEKIRGRRRHTWIPDTAIEVVDRG